MELLGKALNSPGSPGGPEKEEYPQAKKKICAKSPKHERTGHFV